jgi:hypothetical protein
MPVARFAEPDAASPMAGSHPRAGSPGAVRPAVQHPVAHPARGLNRIVCVMPTHAAGRQPEPRLGARKGWGLPSKNRKGESP